MIILDTSIWIEFIKRNEPYLSEVKLLLTTRTAVAIEPVFGELLQGCKSQKEKKLILDYWQYTTKIKVDDLFIKAGIYSHDEKLLSKGVGLMDATLIYAAIQNGYKLWTLDKQIIKALESKYNYKPITH